MAPRMVCKINIGTRMQQVFIEGEKYSKKKTIETFWMPLDDISTFIADHEDVEDVYLVGPMAITKHIQKIAETKEQEQYKKVFTNFHYHQE